MRATKNNTKSWKAHIDNTIEMYEGLPEELVGAPGPSPPSIFFVMPNMT